MDSQDAILPKAPCCFLVYSSASLLEEKRRNWAGQRDINQSAAGSGVEHESNGSSNMAYLLFLGIFSGCRGLDPGKIERCWIK